MTDVPSGIEWHLARDGRQYGPLSETEMRAFVDLGHLRPTDLIWRMGFPDWRPASEVFAAPTAPQEVLSKAVAPAQPTPAEQPARHPDQAREFTTDPAPAMAAAHTAAQLAPQGTVQQRPSEPQQRRQGIEPAKQNPAGREETRPQASAAPLHFPVQGSRIPEPKLQPLRTPQPAASGDGAHRLAPSPKELPKGIAMAMPRRDQRPAVVTTPVEDDDDDQPSRRFGFGRVAAVLLLAILAGGGVAAYTKRAELAAYLPADFFVIGSTADASQTTVPLAAPGTSREAIDARFQSTPIWRHIKSEFPEWYAERIQETITFTTEKRGDAVITKHLAESIVALRRKHAEEALTASPERLKFVASAFLDNLQALAKQNVDTCYGFISQGETFPAVLDMLQKPSGNEPLQKQVVAVFEAISDGRKMPQSYLPPRKSDYDALAAELTARGWTENDLRTFSDPRALGRASPQQVCRMVQDWFAAQIAIKDPASQLRLLVESLRPVVAG